MTTKKVLSLGQCAADNWSISRLLSESLGAAVSEADSFEEALTLLRNDTFALVLVNRVLDVDGASGLDFITRLKSDDALRSIPVMLVSNIADAQRQAVTKGGLPGFGKAALHQSSTLEQLRSILEATSEPSAH
jgi:response regulator RpfG family c-di-GMP phosphodiesterase